MSRLANVDFPEPNEPVTTVMDGLPAQSSIVRSQSSGAISGHNGLERVSAPDSVTYTKNSQFGYEL